MRDLWKFKLFSQLSFDFLAKKRKSEVLKASDSMRKFSLIDGEESLSMKNKLQEIAQKSGLKMPEYHVSGTNQNFMATVSFQGRSFSSTRAFAKKKPAEHDAANVALYELGHVSKPPYGWVTRRPMLPGNTQQYQQSIGNAGAKSKGILTIKKFMRLVFACRQIYSLIFTVFCFYQKIFLVLVGMQVFLSLKLEKLVVISYH